ncbi:MAG TPA: hypothetical protein DCQ98_00980 [Planctomycetaceae bacterium]|nr:hypothetical protein [Planctomycetaceae bacterium]
MPSNSAAATTGNDADVGGRIDGGSSGGPAKGAYPAARSEAERSVLPGESIDVGEDSRGFRAGRSPRMRRS